MPDRSAFDSETLSIMGDALDDVWGEFESRSTIRAGAEKAGIRRALALRIMAAVRVGQRDPERLREVALHMLDGCRVVPASEWVPQR